MGVVPYKDPAAAEARWARYYAANRERILQRKNEYRRRGRSRCGDGVPADAWLAICQLYDFRCHYCGQAELFELLTRDHVVPVSRGGCDEPSNVVPACNACNLAKGAMTEPEYRATIGVP